MVMPQISRIANSFEKEKPEYLISETLFYAQSKNRFLT